MKLPKNIEKEASSKSINKTISELSRLMEGSRISANGPLRKKLHDSIFRLLREKARFWYQRGFRRGHETARARSKGVPLELRRAMKMYAVFLPDEGRRIVLRSKLKP